MQTFEISVLIGTEKQLSSNYPRDKMIVIARTGMQGELLLCLQQWRQTTNGIATLSSLRNNVRAMLLIDSLSGIEVINVLMR